MALTTFFKPNPSNKGFMLGLRAATSDKGDIISFIQTVEQDGWANGTGSFAGSMQDPERKISVMLNATELAGIVNAITHRTEPFKAFHKTPSSTTQISFSYHQPEGNDRDGNPKPPGFFYSVKKGQKSHRFAFTMSEATLFKICIERLISDEAQRVFMQDIEDFQKRSEEKQGGRRQK